MPKFLTRKSLTSKVLAPKFLSSWRFIKLFNKFFHIRHKIGKNAISTYLLLSYMMMVVTIFYFANRGFDFYLESQTMRMESAAYEIEADFSGLLDDLEAMIGHINRKIMTSSGSKSHINSILRFSGDVRGHHSNLQNILSDGTFFWIDAKRTLLMSSEYGILKMPVSVSGCDYLANTERNPWQIFLGEPAIGAASGQYVLPVGVGVNNADGSYLGTLATGIKVYDLIDRFSRISNFYQVDFAVIDSKSRILLESKPDLFSTDRKLLRALNNITLERGNRIILDYSMWYSDRKYVVVRSFDKYPYMVLISLPNGKITSEAFVEEVWPHLIELMIVTIFFASIFYFVRTSLKR